MDKLSNEIIIFHTIWLEIQDGRKNTEGIDTGYITNKYIH